MNFRPLIHRCTTIHQLKRIIKMEFLETTTKYINRNSQQMNPCKGITPLKEKTNPVFSFSCY